MFGYIRPLECELRVREQREYRAHYCGLCKAIGRRYGQLARLTLHYDCAFLSAFLCARAGAPQAEARRCLCHPFRGKQPMMGPNDATDYAADVNVLLAWHSAVDHWRDERRFAALLLQIALSPARRRAERRQPELAAHVRTCLARLGELERRNAECTDEPSDAFGELMRGVIARAPATESSERPACDWMFYNLGRWVYLADAWDDRDKDKKRGAYNAFLAAGSNAEQAEFLLTVSLAEANSGYDLVTMHGPHGLIDNIMGLGCPERTRRLLHPAEGAPGCCAGNTKENAE